MRHGFVSTTWAVHMIGFVTTGAVRTVIGVLRAHFYLVLIYMISMGMMQVPVVQVIDVITMRSGLARHRQQPGIEPYVPRVSTARFRCRQRCDRESRGTGCDDGGGVVAGGGP
ncbi:protein of unknown function (plasmid) [Caballeronia sp. S22]